MEEEALWDPYIPGCSPEEVYPPSAVLASLQDVSLNSFDGATDNEVELVAMSDPYILENSEVIGFLHVNSCGTQGSAKSTQPFERFESPVTWREIGKMLCAGIQSGAAPRGFEFFTELLASSDACSTPQQPESKRRWKLFPLPVDFNGCLAETANSTADSLGARPWATLVCMGLNWLAGEKVMGPPERKSRQVKAVLQNLESRLFRFFDEIDDECLVPQKLWEDVVSKRIGYDGEEVADPVPLSYEQILKSVPPPGHGGAVQLSPLLVGQTRHLVEHAEECVLDKKFWGKGPSTAAVHIVRGHERLVWKLLEERGVIEWFPLKDIF